MNRLMPLGRRWTALAIAALDTLIFSAMAIAQSNSGLDQTVTTTRTTTTVWYGEWWVWAAAVGVFLIVIVALTTRGSSRA